MYQAIHDLLAETGLTTPTSLIAYLLSLVIVSAVCYALRLATQVILVAAARRAVDRSGHAWMSTLYKNRLFHRIANLAIPVAMTLFAEDLPQYGGFLAKAAGVAWVAVFLLLFRSLVKTVDEVYQRHEVARTRPIKSVLQVLEVAVIIVGGLACIAIFSGTSVSVLLGGIGAATAVTSLIFKDSILGFVAGIQLISNDMIRMGDWIYVPKHSADGTVVELSVTTVKVENFDKSITTIPPYTLVSDAFINWRGMENAGGRRIKRAFSVDSLDVCLADSGMIERFRRMELLSGYLDGKLREITDDNERRGADLSEPVNGRRITNLGTFRAYISAYLAQHPGIHHGMSCMVRQLSPEGRGIPLEIYAFANTTAWPEYEDIQSDIFDHLYAVAGEFGLHIFQEPSGGDIRSIGT